MMRSLTRVVVVSIVVALCGSVLHAPVDQASANASVVRLGKQGVEMLVRVAPHVKRWGPLLMTIIGAIGTMCKGDMSSRCLRSVQAHLVTSGKMTVDQLHELQRTLVQVCRFARFPVVCDAVGRALDGRVVAVKVSERQQRTRPTSSSRKDENDPPPPSTSSLTKIQRCEQLFTQMEKQLQILQHWENALAQFDVPTKDVQDVDQKMIDAIFQSLKKFSKNHSDQINDLLQLPHTPKQARDVFWIMNNGKRSSENLIALLDALRQIPTSSDRASPFSQYGPVRSVIDAIDVQKSGMLTYLKLTGAEKKQLWQNIKSDIDFLRTQVDGENEFFDANKTCTHAPGVNTLIAVTIDRYVKQYPFLEKQNSTLFSTGNVQSKLIGLFQRITLKLGAFLGRFHKGTTSKIGGKR